MISKKHVSRPHYEVKDDQNNVTEKMYAHEEDIKPSSTEKSNKVN